MDWSRFAEHFNATYTFKSSEPTKGALPNGQSSFCDIETWGVGRGGPDAPKSLGDVLFLRGQLHITLPEKFNNGQKGENVRLSDILPSFV